MIDGAEAQRVERGDRAGAHGKNIAQNAAHAGGRALIGLDERRVVVAFHLERHRQTVADVDDAGVLTRPLQDVGTFGGKIFQIITRALITTVLRPHDRENAELGEVRRMAEDADDFLIFLRVESVTGRQLRGNFRLN